MIDLDTIVAIATPPGTGGVAIVRMSGPRAREIAQAMVRTGGGHPVAPALTERTEKALLVGVLVEPGSGRRLDEAVILVFVGPRSYTTEDVVEFQIHAGPATIERVLTACLACGARLATRGEFTRRAYLGGRLDLTRAEAVLELAQARTDRALDAALNQLDGHLARFTNALREPIRHLLAEIEASIDFPDELDVPPSARILATLEDLRDRIQGLLAEVPAARLVREGARVALLGPPNVGKSSLLNALIASDRAIVTEHAGTTRDVLEETWTVHGIPCRILDTAGIRQEEVDPVERLGIARSEQALREAELRLVVMDGTRTADPAVQELHERARAHGPTVLVVNKGDLAGWRSPDWEADAIRVSARTGEGLDHLTTAVWRELTSGTVQLVPSVAINARHEAALTRACEALCQARQACQDALPVDLVAHDLRTALELLGTVQGEALTEEVIDHIFERFCVGK